MTSPYAFYQFWFNIDDSDVINCFKLFTFRTRDEIEAFEREVREQPAGARRSGSSPRT